MKMVYFMSVIKQGKRFLMDIPWVPRKVKTTPLTDYQGWAGGSCFIALLDGEVFTAKVRLNEPEIQILQIQI